MLSFRYAENFACGKGLVFNEGERVEVYTNFLWTIILGICIKLGFDVVLSSKILGIFLSLLNIFFMMKLSELISIL